MEILFVVFQIFGSLENLILSESLLNTFFYYFLNRILCLGVLGETRFDCIKMSLKS